MSNLNIFKVSIGPSSSHTLGPLLIGNRFCADIQELLPQVTRLQVTLYGSLSFTGRGHLTDKAILWGLTNLKPETISAAEQIEVLQRVEDQSQLMLAGQYVIHFSTEDLIFSEEFLPLHPNALRIAIWDKNQNSLGEYTYYSVGGGFIMDEASLQAATNQSSSSQNSPNQSSSSQNSPNQSSSSQNSPNQSSPSQNSPSQNPTQTGAADSPPTWDLPHAKDALLKAEQHGWNLWELSWNYELQFNTADYIRDYCLRMWKLMQSTYHNGINSEEQILPGTLQLKRRARALAKSLAATQDPLGVLDYISLYAMAVSEENASGMRVVAAPTNGACAVVPAVMLYLKYHSPDFSDEQAIRFLLCAMLIGGFYKRNASISGADAGCQAEVGSASSMAAGAMATILGAPLKIAFNAAEIAMEHHLGMTCDPVAGLVQIPCIERNAFGAIKAISAARMALRRESDPKVSLDDVIKTMYQTGKDMHMKYKETSLGGLASTLSNLC